MNFFYKILIIFVLGFLVGFLVVQDNGIISRLPDQDNDNDIVKAQAHGTAVWFLTDHQHLDPELYGTPNHPLKTDVIPLSNREVSDDGSKYTTLTDSEVFSLDRVTVSGSINIEAQDLSALDNPSSKDWAKLEANFKSPDGQDFKVVLKRVMQGFKGNQFYGGVAQNRFVHGEGVGSGVLTLPTEFSYLTIFGVADVYRNGELIDTDRVMYLAISEKAREDEFRSGDRPLSQIENIIVHLVLKSYKVEPDDSFITSALPTGFIDPHGDEQGFFHVNFVENIKVTGNQFLDS